jgi:hypothetical protein
MHMTSYKLLQLKLRFGSCYRKLESGDSSLVHGGRRLAVVTIGHFFEPSGSFPLVLDLGRRQMDEIPVGCRTRPIAGIQQNYRGITPMQLLDLFVRQSDGENRNRLNRQQTKDKSDG